MVNPPTKSYNMGANTLAFVDSHRDFWITPLFNCTFSGPGRGEYGPWYVPTTGGWWACISLWGIQIEVTLGGPDE